MTQTERITRMEGYLNESLKAQNALAEALDRYEAAQAGYRKLEAYYAGPRWRKDYEDDEAGKIPKHLPRGVLSEDAVYDLLTEHHLLTVRMLELATKTVRGS